MAVKFAKVFECDWLQHKGKKKRIATTFKAALLSFNALEMRSLAIQAVRCLRTCCLSTLPEEPYVI